LNTNNGSNAVFSVGANSFRTIRQNDHYFDFNGRVQNGAGSPFNGNDFTNGGVGAGTLAQRPSNCQAGMAYWAADQGSWNTTMQGGYQLGGSGPTYYNGVLYTCISNSWSASPTYTPYAFPDPLTTGANTLSFTSQPTNTVTANPFIPPVVVTISAAVSDSITVSINSCGAGLSGTTTVSAIIGVATFLGVGVTGTGTNCVITAHDNTDGTVQDMTSNRFDVTNTAPANTLSFTSQPTSTVMGNPFIPTVVVRISALVTDSITISVNGCGAGLSGTTTVSAVIGVATFLGVGVTGTGTNCVLTAHDNTDGTVQNVASNPFSVTNTPTPPANTLSFFSQPTNTAPDNPFIPTVVVRISAAVTDSITISVNGCGAGLSGTTTVSAVIGVATFLGVGVTGTGTNCVLTAHDNTDGTVQNMMSNPFSLTNNPSQNTTQSVAPPAVSITQPVNGQTVFGTYTVCATVTSSSGIAGVQFQLDGGPLGAQVTASTQGNACPQVTASTYSIQWITTTSTNALHTLTVIATDTGQNVGNAFPIVVTVSNLQPTLTQNLSENAGLSVPVGNASGPTMQEYYAVVQQNAASVRAVTDPANPRIEPRVVSNSSSFAVGGVAIIGYRPNGILVSEAGVPASPQITSGRVYTEISNTLNTGIALANPTSNDATVNFYFTDVTGRDFDAGTMPLHANQQLVQFLNQAPFNGPSGTAAAFQGTFTFMSDQPIGAIALRQFTNERGELLLTTLPVAPVGVSPNANVLPQFADGAGWTTSILLTNASGSTDASGSKGFTETGTIQFFGQDGTPGETVSYSIPVRSSYRFDTSGLGSSVQVGWIAVTPVSSSGGPFSSNDVPSAVSLIQLRQGDTTISDTTFIASPKGTNFQLYMEASGVTGQPGSVQSGLVIANPSSTPVIAQIDLYNLDGTSANLPTAKMINIPPGGQISEFINQFFPAMPVSFKGIANLTTSFPVAVAALRGNYNEAPRGEFLMTTTAPVNDAFPSSGTLVFPQVVSGKGFSTQIIVFGQNPGSVNLDLFSSSGGHQPTLP
jgi:hypothetical protein